ncbi:MAG: putative sulfate exporter family transporter, partial [Actinomycetota bacterium]
LIPLILLLARGQSDSRSLRKATPTFVFAFVACALIVNALSLPDSFISLGKESSKVLLSIGLFGMGLSVKWAQIRALGAKPLLFGLGAWVGCGVFALAVIRGVGL